MIDIAALAGVSQTTVSLVLNHAVGARLSEATRKRVLRAAKTLGYQLAQRGNGQAVSGKKVIAFIADEISTDPWCAIALDGAREKAWENGLTLTVALTRGDLEMEEAVLAQCAAQPLLGIIYATIQTRQINPGAGLLRVPTVLLNCYAGDHALPAIVPGETAGGRTATLRLIGAGHRRIGIILGETGMDASRDRLKGYRQALASHDLVFDGDLVRPGNWEPSAGYVETMALMRLPDAPTAIFCCNDLMALGCYDALKELGRNIPDDVAVIGYDDREVAHCLRPPLTTILLPHFEMGRLAAQHIIEHDSRPRTRPRQIRVECPLVERASVGALEMAEP